MWIISFLSDMPIKLDSVLFLFQADPPIGPHRFSATTRVCHLCQYVRIILQDGIVMSSALAR